MSDQANITFSQATCVSLKDLVDTPGISKEHAAMPTCLLSKLDCVYLLAHAINPSLDEMLEPHVALKLAVELRLEDQ